MKHIAANTLDVVVWSLGQAASFPGISVVSFVFADGRIAELRCTDVADGHFVLGLWGQGDGTDRKRNSALSGSFDVTPHQAQINRLAVYSDAGGDMVVTPKRGPEVWCELGDPGQPIERIANATCVDMRLPGGGPVVQFGCNALEFEPGPGVVYVRGWPTPPQVGEEDDHLPHEYLGIYTTLRGRRAVITSTHAEANRG